MKTIVDQLFGRVLDFVKQHPVLSFFLLLGAVVMPPLMDVLRFLRFVLSGVGNVLGGAGKVGQGVSKLFMTMAEAFKLPMEVLKNRQAKGKGFGLWAVLIGVLAVVPFGFAGIVLLVYLASDKKKTELADKGAESAVSIDASLSTPDVSPVATPGIGDGNGWDVLDIIPDWLYNVGQKK